MNQNERLMKRCNAGMTILAFIFMLSAATTAFSAGSVSEQVIGAIQSGNAPEISRHFNSMVDLTVPGFDDSYSKAQAGQILRDFFVQYPVKSFKVTREGSSPDGSRFVIGTLETAKKTFRVYFLLKTVNGTDLIHQFQVQDS